jgi:hypothetical protein
MMENSDYSSRFWFFLQMQRYPEYVMMDCGDIFIYEDGIVQYYYL